MAKHVRNHWAWVLSMALIAGVTFLVFASHSVDEDHSNESWSFGKIGIGTINPELTLDVAGPVNLNRGLSGIALRVNGAEALWYNGTYFSWGYGGSFNYFADKVGIGTTNPQQKLDVDHGDILVQGSGSCDTPGEAGTLYLGTVHHYIKGEYGFGVKIGTYAVGDVIAVKEISGNVGIGTNDPGNAKLAVNGTTRTAVLEITDSQGRTGLRLKVDNQDSNRGRIEFFDSNGRLVGFIDASTILGAAQPTSGVRGKADYVSAESMPFLQNQVDQLRARLDDLEARLNALAP